MIPGTNGKPPDILNTVAGILFILANIIEVIATKTEAIKIAPIEFGIKGINDQLLIQPIIPVIPQ